MIHTILPLSLLVPLAVPLAAQEGESPRPGDVFTEFRSDEPGPIELKLYPVREYLAAFRTQDDRGPTLELTATDDPDHPPQPDRPLLGNLRDAARTFVEPPLQDGEDIQAIGREHLALAGRTAQHAWLQDFLDLQRQNADTTATLDFVLLRVRPEAAAALAIGTEPRVLDATAATEFRARMRGPDGTPIEGMDALHAPRVTMFTLQRAQVSAVSQTSYVRDFDVIDLDDGTTIADPLIATAREGIELDGSFVVLATNTLGLAWRVTILDLARPIPRFEKKVRDQSLTIQVPDVARATFEAEVVTTPGTLAVFPGPELRGDRLVLLMSIASIDAVAAERRETPEEAPRGDGRK